MVCNLFTIKNNAAEAIMKIKMIIMLKSLRSLKDPTFASTKIFSD